MASSLRRPCNEDEPLKNRKELTEVGHSWNSIGIHAACVVCRVTVLLSASTTSKVLGSGDSVILTANTDMPSKTTITTTPVPGGEGRREGEPRSNEAPPEVKWICGTGANER